MEGADQVRQILKLTGSTSTPPAQLIGSQQDDTVTEHDDEAVAETCETPDKGENEEHTAPSSNEKAELGPRLQVIRLFTDESREQEIKDKKVREFGPKLPIETLKAVGKKRTLEMRENIKRMYQTA